MISNKSNILTFIRTQSIRVRAGEVIFIFIYIAP